MGEEVCGSAHIGRVLGWAGGGALVFGAEASCRMLEQDEGLIVGVFPPLQRGTG